MDRLRTQWASELPDLDTEPMALLGRIYRIARIAGRQIERNFAELGLDRSEFDVLATLRRAGAPYRLSPTALFRSLMASSGGMTHRLSRLERAGFVERLPDPEDARSKLVRLTPAGRRLVERAFRADMALEADLLAELSEKERARLASSLRTLLRSLERRGLEGRDK